MALRLLNASHFFISFISAAKLDKVEIDGVRVTDVQGLVMPKGVMRGSLLGMSYLAKLKSFNAGHHGEAVEILEPAQFSALNWAMALNIRNFSAA